ncbi:hypothetical protein [Microbacterium sp. G2-8]|nr:hypothetical protein [Microbacterium sp. G2-8]
MAHPVGERYRYKVRQKTYNLLTYSVLAVKTTGWKYAFNPKRNHIYCTVR